MFRLRTRLETESTGDRCGEPIVSRQDYCMQATKHYLTVPAQSWSLEELHEFCKRALGSPAVTKQVYRQLVLAIDEVAANIVEHAYPDGNKKGDLEITVDLQDDRIVVEMRDWGVDFNPLTAKQVDPQRSFSARLRRGYSLPIIRRIIEEIKYERTPGGQNVLTMTKFLRPDEEDSE